MSFLARVRSASAVFLRRKAISADMDEELRSHIGLRADDLERQGLTRVEAERLARIEFGGVEKFRELSRETLGGSSVERSFQDLRYALRQLRRAPGFVWTVILTIALALGANLTVFAFFKAILLNTLPVRNPGELFRVTIHYPGHPEIQYFSYPDLQQMASSSSPAELVGSTQVVQYHARNEDGTTGTLQGQLVTGNFFSALGTGMLLGRPISEQDNMQGSEPVGVISYGLWSGQYGKDPGILGKRLLLQRVNVTIVGVTPKAFQGINPGERTDIWMPLSVQPAVGFGGYASMHGVDASKPWFTQDVSWLQLIARSPADPGGRQLAARLETYIQAEVHSVLASVRDPSQREALTHVHVQLGSAAGGMPDLRDRFSVPLTILSCLAGFLLLSGCLNIVNLVLARFRSREHEMSVRLSLGSGRRRLIAQHAMESLMLCMIGAAASFALARAASSLIQHWLLIDQSIEVEARISSSTLVFGIVVVLGTWLLISIAPARRIRDLTLSRVLSLHTSSGGNRPSQASDSLVIGQLALATFTLAITTLLLHTLWNYEALDIGVDPRHTLSVSLDPSAAGYITYAQQATLYQELTGAVDRIPGVVSSSVAGCGLMNDGCAYLEATIPGAKTQPFVVERNYVGSAYFSTTGMRILEGREFSDGDSAAGEPVAVVNREFERKFLGGQSGIGRTVQFAGRKPAHIVGVVGDARTDSIQSPPSPFVYLPIAQAGGWNISHLEVRTAGAPLLIAAEVRDAILGINRAIPITEIVTLQEETERGLTRELLMARLGAVFSALSLLIAAVGTYGFISYEMGRKRFEFAIRMAVGATRAAILRRVFARSAFLCAMGCTVGILASLVLSRFLASLLFGVSRYDLAAYSGAILVLMITSAAAVFVPSWQAASVDPVSALRNE